MRTQDFFFTSPYFKEREFDSPDEPGSGILMDTDFLIKLSQARAYAKIPFVITSGYRSKAHNARVGGVPNSAHRTGHAADIRARTSTDRAMIVKSLFDAGFNRIGIGNSFVHVDDDPSKSPMVMWLYGSDVPAPLKIPLSKFKVWWNKVLNKDRGHL